MLITSIKGGTEFLSKLTSTTIPYQTKPYQTNSGTALTVKLLVTAMYYTVAKKRAVSTVGAGIISFIDEVVIRDNYELWITISEAQPPLPLKVLVFCQLNVNIYTQLVGMSYKQLFYSSVQYSTVRV